MAVQWAVELYSYKMKPFKELEVRMNAFMDGGQKIGIG